MIWMIVTMKIEEDSGKKGFLRGSPSSVTWVTQQQAVTSSLRQCVSQMLRL
jgi:hypothetical protein